MKSGKRNVAAKRKGTPKSFEEYLASVPAPARGALKQMRAAIRSAVPAEAVEIISYGIPAFKHKRVLVWYAAFSKHCSLFPTASVIEAFKEELKGLRDIQRDHSVSDGQAVADSAYQETGESTGEAGRKQERALIWPCCRARR